MFNLPAIVDIDFGYRKYQNLVTNLLEGDKIVRVYNYWLELHFICLHHAFSIMRFSEQRVGSLCSPCLALSLYYTKSSGSLLV